MVSQCIGVIVCAGACNSNARLNKRSWWMLQCHAGLGVPGFQAVLCHTGTGKAVAAVTGTHEGTAGVIMAEKAPMPLKSHSAGAVDSSPIDAYVCVLQHQAPPNSTTCHAHRILSTTDALGHSVCSPQRQWHSCPLAALRSRRSTDLSTTAAAAVRKQPAAVHAG